MKAVKLNPEASPSPSKNSRASIESLRDYYHSIHDAERVEVIELLGAMTESEASRELVQLYEECEWRGTRFSIIQALKINPNQRSLEFLFQLAQKQDDISIAEAAVRALGQTHHRLAALFLVNYYSRCPEAIKPALIGALGQVPDRSLGAEFLAELPKAIEAQQIPLIRNLIVTLGELKILESVPLLIEIAVQKKISAHSICALVALGKMCRDVKVLNQLENRFRDDLFEYQIFSSVKSQIQARSEQVSTPELSSSLRPSLKIVESIDTSDPLLWFEGPALGLSDADKQFKAYFESKDYRELSDENKVRAINALFNYGLVVQTNPEKLQAVSRVLETALGLETSLSVQGRIVRALGYLGIQSKKGGQFIKDFLGRISEEIKNGKNNTTRSDLVSGNTPVSNLLGSSLKYLELCPDKSCSLALFSLLEGVTHDFANSALKIALFRAFKSASSIPEPQLKKLEVLVKSSLDGFQKDEALCIAALKLLQTRVMMNLIHSIINCLSGSSRVQLAAIITLKSYSTEESVEKLASFLGSSLQSLSGRALDTLTGLPGIRAKRLIIDFLKEKVNDTEICDKIIRCFKVPETQTDYFVKNVDEILRKYPAHPSLDGLILLREKLRAQSLDGARPGFIPKGDDIEIIDRELSSKIVGYAEFDESTQSALRSAELPYQHREMFDEYVDKGSSVIEYCKAIDLLLEKVLGKKIIFPKLEHGLHEFQNVLHAVGLQEDSPNAQYVMKQMDLEKHFNLQSFPLHKMSTIAFGIRTGRIINEQFKILDGLRAWAVMLLLFGRKIQGTKPIVQLKVASDDQIVSFSKRLMKLQDIRNPVAHRQTVVKFAVLDEVRNEVFALLSTLQKMI